jgi:hypothetical protein
MIGKIFILLIIICLGILIIDNIPISVEKLDNDSYLVTRDNLTYSFYNVSTGEVAEKDSGIPIYDKISKNER